MLSSLLDEIDKREAARTSFEGSGVDTSLVIPEVEDEIHSEMNFEQIVGKSAALGRVLKQVETVAPTESTVMIYGETGTGKELVARALHNLSPRRAGAFVKLNCAAIPTGLLESELFGHEKGAFTGAIAQRIGRFELASRGTAFLDEIGEIPLELQPKLLRVLQEREFERLGSDEPRFDSHGRRAEIPFRSFLPAQCLSGSYSSAARASRRYSLTGASFHSAVRRAYEQENRKHLFRDDECLVRSPLARQHPRTAECNRACRDPLVRASIEGCGLRFAKE
jgi:hypothetical protein